eukprot:sb/3465025/
MMSRDYDKMRGRSSSIYLSNSLSLSLYLSLSLSLSLSHSLSLYLSRSISPPLSFSLSFSLSLPLSIPPTNPNVSTQESPPRDLSKKETKMRAIFGSPHKDVWSKVGKTVPTPGSVINKDHHHHHEQQMTAFKGIQRQALRDENVDLNGLNQFYPGRNFYEPPPVGPQTNDLLSCGMLYPSPPGYDEGVILSPGMSPEERLKQQTQAPLMCGQISPYSFYAPPTSVAPPLSPSSHHNFWNTSGLIMSPATHLPITPPQTVKLEKVTSSADYIPTLGEVSPLKLAPVLDQKERLRLNCATVDDSVEGFYNGSSTLNAFEQYSKRRKIDSGPSSLSFTGPSTIIGGEMWPHYIQPTTSEFIQNTGPVKMEPGTLQVDATPVLSSALYAEQHLLEQHQDNYISLMLRSDDRPITDQQPAQLTKL